MQLNLFDTSSPGIENRDANYLETKPKHPSQRQRILDHLSKMRNVGATRDEIACSLSLPLASVCGRVSELVEMGLAKETKEKRSTSNGRTAVVVVAV